MKCPTDNSAPHTFLFPQRLKPLYVRSMPLVRILVDGYSLLHSWPQLARGNARHSAAARQELIRLLTQYADATGIPITVFFDGSQTARGPRAASAPTEIEVLYSRRGQTADQLIERAVHRFAEYGEVMAVTDDLAERQTVMTLGGTASSCENFIQSIQMALGDLASDIKEHNRKERHRFQRRR